MYMDLSCPVELLHYELHRDDHLNVRAYLTLFNLSEFRVIKIAGSAIWHGQNGGAAPFVADQLNIEPKTEFRIQLSPNKQGEFSGITLQLNQIQFENKTEWHAFGNAIDVNLPPIPTGRELNMLVAAAGTNVRNFPIKAADHWVCVCGRANPESVIICARCGRDQRMVFAHLTPEALAKSELPAETNAETKFEIPAYLGVEAKPVTPEELERQNAEREMAELHSSLKFQRGVLARRSIFLIVLVLLVLLLSYTFEWLSGKQQQAKELIPPVKVEQTASTE